MAPTPTISATSTEAIAITPLKVGSHRRRCGGRGGRSRGWSAAARSRKRSIRSLLGWSVANPDRSPAISSWSLRMANLRWCVSRRNRVLIEQLAHTRERSRRMRLHGPVGKPERQSGLGNVQIQHEPARQNLALHAGKPSNRSDNRIALDHSLKLIDGGHCQRVVLRRT
jgi:hypothetical protein